MKINTVNTVDTVIQDFRDGQNIFRRPSVELMVREISRLQARVAELENSQVQEYHVPPESFNDLMEIFRQGTKDGTIIIKNLTTSNAGLKQKKIEQLEEINQAGINRIAELEAERDYLDGRCAALENDLVLDDVVSKLENVQTRLADFETMARDFVEYKAPDHICRMHFEMMLKESEGE